MFKKISILMFILQCSFNAWGQAELPINLTLSVEVPDIKATPYHRPYIAVWLESTDRKGIHTFAFWREQEDWFKDLRQWWRKVGRKNTPNYDGVTGATRKPGVYTLKWQGQLVDGSSLAAGDYVLHFESVREQGSREYLRQKITLPVKNSQHFKLQGQHELGQINITIN